MKKLILIFCSIFVLFSCDNTMQNSHKDNFKEVEKGNEVQNVNFVKSLPYSDTLYVPIYSDIYQNEFNPKVLLAATLSIRNTSLSDSLYISKIDYHNTKGDLIKSFIELPVGLQALESFDFHIAKEDDTGGSGANFVVVYNAEVKNPKPIIEAIMLGSHGQHGFSFVSPAVSIKKKKD
jgi:hypothetical protein